MVTPKIDANQLFDNIKDSENNEKKITNTGRGTSILIEFTRNIQISFF